MLNLLMIEIIVVVIYMTMWFLVAQVLKRNDIADIAWGTGFIVTALSAMIFTEGVARGAFSLYCL